MDVGRKQKKKQSPKKSQKLQPKTVSTNEELSKAEVESENIVRLKLTTRKGTRIESVPLKKLKKLASSKKLFWKLEDGWLVLFGFN